MTDYQTKLSARMSRIRKKDTKPEMIVRRLTHALGFRYRLHRRELPGTPDLVFPGRRKVILVHGCFWHQHDCQLGRKQPSTNQEYWLPKLRRNIERDEANGIKLKKAGWEILVIWECETRQSIGLADKIRGFLTGLDPLPRGQ
jgi:DNA mismatch endonuclease (patch repair protein)